MISYAEYIAQEKRIYAKTNMTGDHDIICTRQPEMFPRWADLVGTLVNAGTVVVDNGIKYLTMQAVTPVASQPPGGVGMLAVYKPYRDSGEYEWMYGEYVEIGWIRIWNGVRYRAIQNPGANINSPETVPAIWEVVT